METLFFAQKAFIVRGRRLLLIQKSPHAPVWPGKWEVPGGRLESGETLDSHLRREVLEEVGIPVRAIEPFHLWDWHLKGPDGHESRVVAAAVLCAPEAEACTLQNQVEGDDIAAYEWVEFHRLREYDFIPNMIPVVEKFLTKYGEQADPRP